MLFNREKHIISKVPYITTYHGTSSSRLKNILREGLKAKKPQGVYDKGVYLTNDINLAATYAISASQEDKSKPVILEIRLSGPKRVKKIYRDPLDREEEAFDYEETPYSESIEDLENDIRDIIGSWDIPENIRSSTMYGELDDLFGLNLYKSLISYAKKRGWDIPKFKKRMFEAIPVGADYTYFEVSKDGTIIPTKEYFYDIHQQIYPKDIPPQAIKAVWVSGLPETTKGDKITISPKLLPHEKKNLLEQLKNLSREAYSSDFDEWTVEYVIDELKYLNNQGWFSEVIKDLEDALKRKDFDQAKEIIDNLDYLSYDMFDRDNAEYNITFTRVSPNKALSLI